MAKKNTALKLSIGCDPEIFLTDSKGHYIPAWDMVKGTKAVPHKVEGGAVQVDGLALEINIDPAHTREEFVNRVTGVTKILAGMVPKYNLTFTPVARFDPRLLETLPPEALELGCEPDFNAYDGKENPRPTTKEPMRTAGGHIHVGWTQDRDVKDKSHIEDCFMVVKQLDFYLGIFSVLWDKDKLRRTLYGQAGACRIKPYGVEYRPLSNKWMETPELTGWVFDQTVRAVTDLQKQIYREGSNPGVARTIINGSNDNWQWDYGEIVPGTPMPPGGTWGERVRNRGW